MSVDYPDWGAPQANATAISTTGVPLLTSPNELLAISQTINAGVTYESALLTVTQPGYEISISAFESGSGATGPIEVSMVWLDETGVNDVAQENWYFWPGLTVASHTLYGKGPTKGGTLLIFIANTSSAMQYTVQAQIYQRSHNYTRDDWRSRGYSSSSSNNTVATSDPPAGLLGFLSQSVAAAGTVTLELPLYSGLAYLYMDTASLTTDMTLTIQDSADPNSVGAGTRIQRYETSSAGLFSGQIALPRYQCRVQVVNNNAAAKVLFWSLHTIEQSV